MKYYHIIYNSSESNSTGAVGFGIRTYSKGTPKAVLDEINKLDFFSDDWDNYEDKPNPAKLLANPELMNSFAKNYIFTSFVAENKQYYAIARRAYVGFDYAFYKNGKAARTGNYVTDYYVFDSEPEKEVYDLFFEENSMEEIHFKPLDVAPSVENVEMKEISLGSQELLEETDGNFPLVQKDYANFKSCYMLYAYEMAYKSQKPLVIKLGKEEVCNVIGNFYKIVSKDIACTAKIYTNLRTNGFNSRYNIFVIHDDYPYEVNEDQCYYADLTGNNDIQTAASKNYGNELSKLVGSDLQENLEDIHCLTSWIISPISDAAKQLDEYSGSLLYTYCTSTGDFTYENLFKDGEINEPLARVLVNHINVEPSAGAHLEMIISEKLNGDYIKPHEMIDELNLVLAIRSYGYDITKIISNVKESICKKITSKEEAFNIILNLFDINDVGLFLDSKICKEHTKCLDVKNAAPHWDTLYRYFVSEQELSHPGTIINRMISDNVDSDISINVVNDLFSNDSEKVMKTYINLVEDNSSPSKTILMDYITAYVEKSDVNMDFLTLFKNHISNPDFANLFYRSFKEKSIATISDLKPYSALFDSNKKFKKLVEANFEEDGLFKTLYSSLYGCAIHEGKGEIIASDIKNYILDKIAFTGGEDYKKWEVLYVGCSYDKDYIRQLTKRHGAEESLVELLDISDKLGNKDLCKGLLPTAYMHMDEDNVDHRSNIIISLLKDELDIATIIKTICQNCSDSSIRRKATGLALKGFGVNLENAQELITKYKALQGEEKLILKEFYAKEIAMAKTKNVIVGLFNKFIGLFKSSEEKKPKKKSK